MENIVIGVILLCVLALIGAYVFNPNFRKDVAKGNGEAKLFGILTTSGSIIIVLVISLVGMIILFIPKESAQHEFYPNPPSWYPINLRGEPIKATLKINDKLINLGLPTKEIKNNELFKEEFALKTDNNNILITKDSLIWGTVSKTQSKGLFTNFKTLIDNELPSDYYEFNQFERILKWDKPKKFFDSFEIAVFGAPYKTSYTINDISNNKRKLLFDSQGAQSVFDTKSTDEKITRKLHFFVKGEFFYLFRITSADPNGTKSNKKYVNFVGIKIEPIM